MAYPDHVPVHDREVVDAILTNALSRSLWVSVWGEGAETADAGATNTPDTITAEVGATDITTLRFHPQTGGCIGWVMLVHGNEPGVLIADHADNEEVRAILAPAEAIQDRQSL